ncbi:tyrosine-type recombinase/integrase [Porphyrobacter sp. LM 6]|uniref:tyrosine-type recombinase/integrase n=1 Tax=Porphyrobacter sp. LM 6 TaxID=1896196 RepID=UPI000846959A|nr:integrase arm-type DNA-binding domain-containing protein [Porphyrobacter sp. LM 6]AOL94496.1 Integrase [Porphyrobacter sp. LM 6]
MGKLTAKQVKDALKVPGSYQDGDGLFLKVDKRGGASWYVRVQSGGKRRDVSLGTAKLISLAEARGMAVLARKAIKIEGRDIIAERRKDKAEAVTFRQAAVQYHSENKGGWKSEGYSEQWLASLERHVFPRFGDRPANDIVASDIIAALSPIWQAYPETGRRVRHRICTVLNFAHARGWRTHEAPSSNGSLKAGNGLPKQTGERQHRKAMPYKAVPEFLEQLRAKPSFGRLALEFAVLTSARSQEARLATWEEIDLEAKLWTCPGEHMKRGKTHIVPLSEAALAVLRKAAALKLAGSNLIFPGMSGGPMSDMTLLKVLRDAGEPFHVHGFRSTFTDWAADKTTFPNAVVDAAKAHKTPDATEAAYRRTTHLEKRTKLMEAWGAYCASRTGGKVIDFPNAVNAG